MLALALLGGAALVLRGWRPPLSALPIACAAFSFWALLAINFVAYRAPDESRYQLVTVTFVLLLAADLGRGLRPRGWMLAAAAAVALLSIGSNLAAYSDGYRFLRDEAAVTKADLGALDIGRDSIDPKFRLLQPIAGSVYMTGVFAGPYYRERDDHGSPAYSPAELAAATPRARAAADSVLASAYSLRLEPAPGPLAGGEGCRSIAPRFDAGLREIALPPGGVALQNGSAPAQLRPTPVRQRAGRRPRRTGGGPVGGIAHPGRRRPPALAARGERRLAAPGLPPAYSPGNSGRLLIPSRVRHFE